MLDASVSRVVAPICRSELIVVDDIGMLPTGQTRPRTSRAGGRRSLRATLGRRHLESALAGFDAIMPEALATADGRPAAPPRPSLAGAKVVLIGPQAVAGKGVVPLG
jgi:hypothetical protein